MKFQAILVIAIAAACAAPAEAWQQQEERAQTVRPGQHPSVAPVRQPRPGNEDDGGEVEVQASTIPLIADIMTRLNMGCFSTSTLQRRMEMVCPDGSTIEVEMECTRTGVGGSWPNCNYREECRQTNAESCPPAETEPEDPDD